MLLKVCSKLAQISTFFPIFYPIKRTLKATVFHYSILDVHFNISYHGRT